MRWPSFKNTFKKPPTEETKFSLSYDLDWRGGTQATTKSFTVSFFFFSIFFLASAVASLNRDHVTVRLELSLLAVDSPLGTGTGR